MVLSSIRLRIEGTLFTQFDDFCTLTLRVLTEVASK